MWGTRSAGGCRARFRWCHTAGCAGGCGEESDSYESNAPLIYGLLMSSNPVRFAAELPVLAAPGARFNYSTASTHLLAGVFERSTRLPNRTSAERNLLAPAGIMLPQWDSDPQGVHFGGSEMFLTTRDMLKFGILYLNQGRVGDRPVVPASWVAASTTKKSGGRHARVSTDGSQSNRLWIPVVDSQRGSACDGLCSWPGRSVHSGGAGPGAGGGRNFGARRAQSPTSNNSTPSFSWWTASFCPSAKPLSIGRVSIGASRGSGVLAERFTDYQRIGSLLRIIRIVEQSTGHRVLPQR